jgi:hypothetical protein
MKRAWRQLLCYVGLHSWPRWSQRKLAAGKLVRRCRRCGKREER